MDLPEDDVGSPFTPTAFVELQLDVLIRQRASLAASQPALAETAIR